MSRPTWTLELHAHTTYSNDSLLSLDKIPGLCQRKGIDQLAITDHNVVTAGLELARLHPMLIIPGIEVMTSHGELLGWYVQGPVPRGLTPSATIGHLREQGALIGVAHPFDRYRKGAWHVEDLLAIVDQIDVIEVFNARCLRSEDNLKALEFARQHGKLMTCGSDAHTPREYGRATMRTRPFRRDPADFRQALPDAERVERLSPASVHFNSTWAKWVKRLGIARRPSE